MATLNAYYNEKYDDNRVKYLKYICGCITKINAFSKIYVVNRFLMYTHYLQLYFEMMEMFIRRVMHILYKSIIYTYLLYKLTTVFLEISLFLRHLVMILWSLVHDL